MTYLSEDDEVRVVTDTTGTSRPEPRRVLDGADILRIQDSVRQVLVAEDVARYAVRLRQLAARPRREARLRPEMGEVGAGLRACTRWSSEPRRAR